MSGAERGAARLMMVSIAAVVVAGLGAVAGLGLVRARTATGDGRTGPVTVSVGSSAGVAAVRVADPVTVSSAVDRELATALGTASGPAALTATEAALDGQVLHLPLSARATAATRADRARRAASVTAIPTLKVYFVNGVMNSLLESTDGAAALGQIFGVPVELAYDRSILQVDDYAVSLCMRGIVARYRDRAGVGDFGTTTLDRVITEPDRDLQAAGDAALTVACRTADGVLSAADLARQKLTDVVLSNTELVAQWMTGA